MQQHVTAFYPKAESKVDECVTLGQALTFFKYNLHVLANEACNYKSEGAE
jgi:hypothetical protein